MYKPRNFEIKKLADISQKNIEEHLKLYEGYVKNTNLILEKLEDPSIGEREKSELGRRFSFEYNGMKNHEYYFEDILSGEPQNISIESDLHFQIKKDFGEYNIWLEKFKTLAKTRGVGWAILGYDKSAGKLLNYWVDEQHIGQLNSVQYVLGIDMWEHAYVGDFWSSGKSDYIEAFFKNLNWSSAENRFAEI